MASDKAEFIGPTGRTVLFPKDFLKPQVYYIYSPVWKFLRARDLAWTVIDIDDKKIWELKDNDK